MNSYRMVTSMNQHLLGAYNITFDGDEWASCQSWRFAVAHVLWHMDECPDEWQYCHSVLCDQPVNQDENFEESEILFLMNGMCGCEASHPVTVADLIEFGNMLDNLRDILVAEGKDY